MGSSSKWLKSLPCLEKPQIEGEKKVEGTRRRKWKLWNIYSSIEKCFKGRRHVAPSGDESGVSDLSPVGEDRVFNAALATIIRAPPKDFIVIRQEWAAIRIQTAFRAFLARRAFKALKALVRLQALVRGRKVRKQAALTLQCMQSLVRVQAQVRARNVRMSSEGQAVQKIPSEHISQGDTIKQAEERCSSISLGSMKKVRPKLQMRQGGVIQRDRAIPNSPSHQKPRLSLSSSPMLEKPVASLKCQGKGENGAKWSWLDHPWMPAKPWECSIDEEIHNEPSEMSSSLKKSDDHTINVRRNNVATRNSIKPLQTHQIRRFPSGRNSKFMSESSSLTTSSKTTSSTALSDNTLTTEGSDGSFSSKPSYMNLTKSIKAKQKDNKNSHLMEDFQCNVKFNSTFCGEHKEY